MMEIPWRHAWWSDRTWERVQRIVAADPSWVKPACHPEMFGFDSRGVAMTAYLLDRACMPVVGMPEEEVMVSRVPIEGRRVRAVYDGRQPGLEEEVGRYPDRPSTWRVVSLMDVIGQERTVSREHDSVVVRVRLPYHRSSGTDLLDDLANLTGDYRAAIGDAAELPGAGYDDLVSTFVETGLGVPHVPRDLRDRLQSAGSWHWSTRLVPSAEWMSCPDDHPGATLEEPVEDHVAVRRGSDWMPSVGMTLSLVYGPLALYVEDAWYGGPRDIGRLTEVFARVSRLVRDAERRVGRLADPPAGEWRRPVVVTHVHGRLACRLWDPVRGERVDLALTGDERHRWADIAHWVETCFVPTGSDRLQA